MHIFSKNTNNAYDYYKVWSGVKGMTWINEYFTIYVVLLILAIGYYMAFVQGPNLRQENMPREGQFLQTTGYAYLIIGIFGLFIYLSK